MKPHPTDGSASPSDRSPANGLEARLRAGASAFAPSPSPALRGRILAAVRAAPAPLARPRAAPLPALPAQAERRGTWLAAAAAALVLGNGWWLAHRAPPPAPRAAGVVALSRELLVAGTRVLALPARAEDNLRLEVERLLEDTTRVTAGVVRGLPAPLRARLERVKPEQM